MRKLLLAITLCCTWICSSQNLVATYELRADEKNDANVFKVLLEVYGDSVTNAILMRQASMPGNVSLRYNRHLEIERVDFNGDKWNCVSKKFKERFEAAVKKQTFFISIKPSEIGIMEEINHSGIRTNPFSRTGVFPILFSPSSKGYYYSEIREGAVKGDFKMVDLAKEKIAKYDSLTVEDIHGKLWK